MKKSTNLRRHAAARPMLLILALLVVGLSYSLVSPPRSAAETETTLQIEQGKDIYMTTCSSCHGLGGEGTTQGPTLIGVGAAAVDFQMGTGRMPAARLEAQIPARKVNYTQEQIEAVAAYVASLGIGPGIPEESQYSLDALNQSADERARAVARGGALFRANCSACHGIVGGGGAMPEGKHAPNLADTTPVHIYEAVRTGPGQMPMFSKDVITDESAREIIAFLEAADEQPNYGGLSMGAAGPVSEGWWVFIIGIGGLSIIAGWIARKGARAR